MHKLNVAVIFGGVSPEHEVSLASAATVIGSMSPERYNIIPVYIARDGKWLLYDGQLDSVKNINWERMGTPAVLSPEKGGSLLRIVGAKVKRVLVDAAFPVLHGANGEDGTIQGLFELAGIPYVGCGVLASAVCMDKSFTKLIAKSLKITQTPYVCLKAEDISAGALRGAAVKLGYPCFVKPAGAGSSYGISKANNKKELAAAAAEALKYDTKIVIEKAVAGRELEVSVLGGGGDVSVSRVGEIIPQREFYDYEAKYSDGGCLAVTRPELPAGVEDDIRKTAERIFRAVDGWGLARVDFFLDGGNRVIFNEINTFPGFTGTSMYPMLWEESGLPKAELVDKLIGLALKRAAARAAIGASGNG